MEKHAGNIQDTDLRLLRVFQAVVRHGGFSAAHEALGLSPATVSNHMSALESRMGVRLCHRGRGGFRLTQQGKQVHSAMLDLFGAIENFRGEVGAAKGDIVGTVEFGAVDAIYTNRSLRLEKAIGEFAKAAPLAKLNVHIASPQELLQGLLTGKLHAILTPTQHLPSALDVTPVFRELQNLYCSKNHSLFSVAEAQITPQMLSKYPFVGRSYEPKEPICGISYNWTSEISHMEGAVLMILSGKYIGFLPDHYADEFVKSGQIRAIGGETAKFFDNFSIALPRKHPNVAAKHFTEIVKENIF
ncbi:LysR family transcriptional regulator [Pseudohalocynthiibacter aestuariivivens]|jgi:DNA-binding transcriptional LysR family regulator|uniref:LysR family transcriptional regulator n=1 Tax=Pseudohalocynthiibacter aestuariivivens TaxID=1591409 RepID=A0ABV5JDZ5_9RHOB|nr:MULTISPECIES: LysR family transcriptional regulator [Pseudohalocynthiibacter]MBS9718102.1 LysR family transcriptional regulator [Pseudohalocynthiibacter aestuariivivens]MCK0103313.1 LysR family transcriptional regulator [Pseudohalocynthiibacter sp. F2068]